MPIIDLPNVRFAKRVENWFRTDDEWLCHLQLIWTKWIVNKLLDLLSTRRKWKIHFRFAFPSFKSPFPAAHQDSAFSWRQRSQQGEWKNPCNDILAANPNPIIQAILSQAYTEMAWRVMLIGQLHFSEIRRVRPADWAPGNWLKLNRCCGAQVAESVCVKGKLLVIKKGLYPLPHRKLPQSFGPTWANYMLKIDVNCISMYQYILVTPTNRSCAKWPLSAQGKICTKAWLQTPIPKKFGDQLAPEVGRPYACLGRFGLNGGTRWRSRCRATRRSAKAVYPTALLPTSHLHRLGAVKAMSKTRKWATAMWLWAFEGLLLENSESKREIQIVCRRSPCFAAADSPGVKLRWDRLQRHFGHDIRSSRLISSHSPCQHTTNHSCHLLISSPDIAFVAEQWGLGLRLWTEAQSGAKP